ncbi:MAG: ABC transporter permease [Abditibacteriales bacterium]|nr:ABC transporter permease [Abditibacteriales bacterium]MDW8368195.1 ABC transporter permease [Abditibacteriales bacterium]
MADRKGAWRNRLRQAQRLRGVLALVAVIALWCVWAPRDADGNRLWLTPSLMKDIFFEQAIFGLLAAGMTLVILTGGIDLSVGAVLGLSAVSFSALLIWREWHPAFAILATLGIGALAGAVNGALVARFRMQPFAATLAMMVVARGVAKWVSHNEKVQSAEANPPIFDTLAGSPLTLVLLMLAVFVVLGVIVSRTQFGRYLYGIGGNEEAVRLSGVSVQRYTMLAYIVCALTAAMAGMCDAARQTLGDPEAGMTYELDAIAAVVIGGTSLRGGQGGIPLTLLGLMIIGIVDKLLSMHGQDLSVRLMAKGLIIVVAVLIQGQREA